LRSSSLEDPARYEMDQELQRATAGAERAAAWTASFAEGDPDVIAFDRDRLWDYVWLRPWDVFCRLVSSVWIAAGIYYAWVTLPGGNIELTRKVDKREKSTQRGEALRSGLAEMGVFFVKVGQTFAQRPDIVGDEIAEELKGLQERSAPFPDEQALRIIREDLNYPGPLAPGVLPEGCDPDAPPLLRELTPRHVASASLGQVYRGRLHDGREVAMKVQRPNIRPVLGLDWAVGVICADLYRKIMSSSNDYTQVVDRVARGVRMELDYHNEAANADEFARSLSFLPFVSSPGWIPELTGPKGSARVLALDWYPSRAPSLLSREERYRMVEMAVEACVVQLLITGFVHADPHEGNIRLGDDGRMVFLDFGLMDRVDFGVMECCAAGVRHVLNQDWVQLSEVFQTVRFAPTPMMKNVNFGTGRREPRYEPCSIEEFAEAVGSRMMSEAGGQSRFGAMAITLKKLSSEYLMLVPPFVALLCRTFLTLEGLLTDEPEWSENFSVYKVALPHAVRRLLSPRTRKGKAELRDTLFRDSRGGLVPKWGAVAELLETSADDAQASAGGGEAEAEDDDPFQATAAVTRRLLRTTEGSTLRRMAYDADAFEAARTFLVSKEAKPLRALAVSALAARWAKARGNRGKQPRVWGPRCEAAAKGWGRWSEDDPYTLPSSDVKRSRRAWRLVLKRQLKRALTPPWRLPLRAAIFVGQLLPACLLLAARAAVRRRPVAVRRPADLASREESVAVTAEDHRRAPTHGEPDPATLN